jgi:hypothetical protein
VRTDELLDRLAADVPAVRPARMRARIAATAGLGGGVALAAVAAGLGLRPDLGQAVGDGMFWMKAAYAVVLALAGLWCAERLARPAGSPRGGVALVTAALATMAAVAVARVFLAPESDRMAMWFGASWRACPGYILALSLPTLALALLAIRSLAPTRLSLAGAAAGLFAGGVAAAAYGLHCTESSPAFLATWYSLGMALSAAVGALAGPWALRWR